MTKLVLRDCKEDKTLFLQIGEQTYASVFNGVVTMHNKTRAFLPLLIQGFIHAQAYAHSVHGLMCKGGPQGRSVAARTL